MKRSGIAGRIAATVAVLMLLAAAPAHSMVLYQYTSVCELECGNVGLNAGDPVGGFIGFSDDAVAFGVVFSPADVETFDIHFGNFSFALPSLGSAFAVFTGTERESFAFEFVTNAPGSSPGYAFAQTNWVAGGSVFEAAYGGLGSLRRVAPEPATLPLLGAAALLALFARRTRSRGR